MMTRIGLLALLALTSCQSTQNRIIVHTGTAIGLEIAQNPASQLYQAKLGYVRTEFAMMPFTNGESADVIMELSYGSIFSLQNSSIKQRLAVGKIAVTQPGAFAMFARNADGNLDTNAVALAKALSSIPTPEPTATANVLPLAQAYSASPRRVDFDTVAVAQGFASFSQFLVKPNLSVSDVAAMAVALKARGLIP